MSEVLGCPVRLRTSSEGKVGVSNRLAAADVGLAMSSGTDVAMESAGVTLLNGDLNGIVPSPSLSRATMSKIRQVDPRVRVRLQRRRHPDRGRLHPMRFWRRHATYAASAARTRPATAMRTANSVSTPGPSRTSHLFHAPLRGRVVAPCVAPTQLTAGPSTSRYSPRSAWAARRPDPRDGPPWGQGGHTYREARRWRPTCCPPLAQRLPVTRAPSRPTWADVSSPQSSLRHSGRYGLLELLAAGPVGNSFGARWVARMGGKAC